MLVFFDQITSFFNFYLHFLHGMLIFRYAVQELVESEMTYVHDLTSITDGYIGTLREMELSDEDREKVKIIFANIEQILDFHKTFVTITAFFNMYLAFSILLIHISSSNKQLNRFDFSYFYKEIEKTLANYEACGQTFLKYVSNLNQ